MLMPKRVKWRKQMRGRMKGKALRGAEVSFGEFGLQALEPGWVTVLLNGVLVQDRSVLRFRKGMCEAGPLMLQDHSGFPGAPDTTMKWRNLWYRPLE